MLAVLAVLRVAAGANEGGLMANCVNGLVLCGAICGANAGGTGVGALIEGGSEGVGSIGAATLGGVLSAVCALAVLIEALCAALNSAARLKETTVIFDLTVAFCIFLFVQFLSVAKSVASKYGAVEKTFGNKNA